VNINNFYTTHHFFIFDIPHEKINVLVSSVKANGALFIDVRNIFGRYKNQK